MQKILILLSLVIALVSCSSDNTYYLRTNDAEGVTVGAKVYRQGVEVGEVTEVTFEDRDVLLEIEIEESLFEDQGFDLGRGPAGEPAVELDRPDRDANELAPGSTLEEKGFGGWFGESDLNSLEETLEEAGHELEVSVEEIFGKDGEKLEKKMEQIFGRDGEKLQNAVEELFGKDGEKVEKAIEDIFGKDGEKLKDLANRFGAEFKEIGEEIKRLEEQYGEDSPEFEEAVKKALREWAESND